MSKLVVKIEKSGNRYNAWSADGTKYTSEITTGARKRAHKKGMALEQRTNKSGNTYWWAVDISEFETTVEEGLLHTFPDGHFDETVEVPTDHTEILDFIHNSYRLKPRGLMMNELKWKYLIRSGVRGKNIMMTGPAGCGKTMAAKALVNSLDRPDYYFNLGATQDPRAT